MWPWFLLAEVELASYLFCPVEDLYDGVTDDEVDASNSINVGPDRGMGRVEHFSGDVAAAAHQCRPKASPRTESLFAEGHDRCCGPNPS